MDAPRQFPNIYVKGGDQSGLQTPRRQEREREMNPSELQFTDTGAQNVRDFGHYNVVMMPDGKTALKSPGTGAVMPRNIPIGGEEIMRQRKMGNA